MTPSTESDPVQLSTGLPFVPEIRNQIYRYLLTLDGDYIHVWMGFRPPYARPRVPSASIFDSYATGDELGRNNLVSTHAVLRAYRALALVSHSTRYEAVTHFFATNGFTIASCGTKPEHKITHFLLVLPPEARHTLQRLKLFRFNFDRDGLTTPPRALETLGAFPGMLCTYTGLRHLRVNLPRRYFGSLSAGALSLSKPWSYVVGTLTRFHLEGMEIRVQENFDDPDDEGRPNQVVKALASGLKKQVGEMDLKRKLRLEVSCPGLKHTMVFAPSGREIDC